MPTFESDWIEGRPALVNKPCEERPHHVTRNVRQLNDAVATLSNALDELLQDIDVVCRPISNPGEPPEKVAAPPVQSLVAGQLDELVSTVLSLTLRINETRRRIDL